MRTRGAKRTRSTVQEAPAWVEKDAGDRKTSYKHTRGMHTGHVFTPNNMCTIEIDKDTLKRKEP